MPTMANITVKNAAGTDVVFVAAMPSAGDSVPARWTQNALTGVAGFRPSFELVFKNNTNGNVRRGDYKFMYPVTYTDPTSGLVKTNQVYQQTGTIFLPKGLTTDQWKEGFVQCGNLLVSALIRSCAEEGYAPT